MLILLSNSRDAEGRYLYHCRDALAALLQGVKRVTFVPYASVIASWDSHVTKVCDALAPLGVSVEGVHTHRRLQELAIERARPRRPKAPKVLRGA